MTVKSDTGAVSFEARRVKGVRDAAFEDRTAEARLSAAARCRGFAAPWHFFWSTLTAVTSPCAFPPTCYQPFADTELQYSVLRR